MQYPVTKTTPWDHQKIALEKQSHFNEYYQALDMGCVSGDMVATINRAGGSKKITIRDLYEGQHLLKNKRWDLSIPTYVRNLRHDIFGLTKLHAIVFKGMQTVYRVTTETGKFVDITIDHELLQNNFKWTSVNKLNIGTRIVVNGCPICGTEKNLITYKYAKYKGYCRSCSKKGERNGNFKGGKIIDKDGYVRISGYHNHPRAQVGGQIYEHIVIAEKKLGRLISTNEVIHHINNNKTDNRPENLKITTASNHNRIHKRIKNIDNDNLVVVPKFERIKSIKKYKTIDTYDLTMESPYNNFVINGIVVKNCGKTKVAIDTINYRQAKLNLVICPVKVIPVWPEQFARHSAVDHEILAITKKIPVKKKAIMIYDAVKLAQMQGRSLTVVLNYEAYWRPPIGPVYDKKTNRIINKGLLLSIQWDTITYDEAHRLMTPGGRASWQAKHLREKAKFVQMLSGTPFPGSFLNIYAQFRALNPKIYPPSFTMFKKKYAIWGGYENRQVIKLINQDDLHKKFYSRAYRVSKRDVVDLPPVMHIIRRCDISSATMKIYNEVKNEFISSVQLEANTTGQISVKNALVKLLRLAQITGGCIQLDDGTEVIKDDSKIRTTIEIIEDLPIDEPIVIFVLFTNEIRRLKNEIIKKTKRSVAELSGNKDQFEQWKKGQYNILVTQIKTGSEGIDMTRACYCIYFSTGFNLGAYEQSLARIDRPGQTMSVAYYHILANNTIDVTINNALRKKQAVIDSILSGICTQGTLT